MKIIKRNKQEVEFDISKIINAITKANEAAKETDRMTPKQITRIAERVTNECAWLTAHMRLQSSM